MERETFQSRLGFLLLSAGCAIGIGNVWKFPYMVGNNGGGIFVLFYLLFLAIMGVPILSMELAIGRGSKKSTVRDNVIQEMCVAQCFCVSKKHPRMLFQEAGVRHHF